MNVEVVLLSEKTQSNVTVVVGNLQQASGICTQLVIKGYGVYMKRTSAEVTHRNSAAAQAFLEVGQMELAYVS